jgi:hypothetical protein
VISNASHHTIREYFFEALWMAEIVALLGQKKAVAIAVKNVSGRLVKASRMAESRLSLADSDDLL